MSSQRGGSPDATRDSGLRGPLGDRRPAADSPWRRRRTRHRVRPIRQRLAMAVTWGSPRRRARATRSVRSGGFTPIQGWFARTGQIW